MDNGDIANRIKEIQASMEESAKSCFDEEELGNLRALIRLTVEFYDYLQHGSTTIAQRLVRKPGFSHLMIHSSGSVDPFNEYDLEYVCQSIRSGVDSFCGLNATYRILEKSVNSLATWNMISSREVLNSQFMAMFHDFNKEMEFENKCRLLLDLFKLQMVFASIASN